MNTCCMTVGMAKEIVKRMSDKIDKEFKNCKDEEPLFVCFSEFADKIRKEMITEPMTRKQLGI